MSAAHPNNPGHSADVRMELRLNGHVLPIAQLAPDYLILANPIDHPPAQAEIAMSIDDQRTRWPVFLPAGLSVGQRRTKITGFQPGDGSPVR